MDAAKKRTAVRFPGMCLGVFRRCLCEDKHIGILEVIDFCQEFSFGMAGVNVLRRI